MNDIEKNKEEKVKSLLKSKKAAAALGLAVVFTIGAAVYVGSKHDDDDDDDSYYTGGSGYTHIHTGSYYYSSGSSYKGGSWSKIAAPKIGSTYSSVRGGSIGG